MSDGVEIPAGFVLEGVKGEPLEDGRAATTYKFTSLIADLERMAQPNHQWDPSDTSFLAACVLSLHRRVVGLETTLAAAEKCP